MPNQVRHDGVSLFHCRVSILVYTYNFPLKKGPRGRREVPPPLKHQTQKTFIMSISKVKEVINDILKKVQVIIFLKIESLKMQERRLKIWV